MGVVNYFKDHLRDHSAVAKPLYKWMLSVSELEFKFPYPAGGFCQQSLLQSWMAIIIIIQDKKTWNLQYINQSTNPLVYYGSNVFEFV